VFGLFDVFVYHTFKTKCISERIVDLQAFDDVGEMKDPKIKVHGE
jgi:hypothetical protein